MTPPDGEPKERDALLAAILAAVPDFVTHLDATGRIRYANRATDIRGLPLELGASWLDQLPPSVRAEAAVAVVSVMASRTPRALELRVETDDGGVAIYATRIAPVVVDDLVTGIVTITRDVTADKHHEALLLRAERTTSVGALAAGVAHEINNPLAVVVANLQLALRRVEHAGDVITIPAVALDELRDAAVCADLVKDIVRDLEIFSRSEGESLGPVDVNRVIEATLRVAWSEVRHRAQIVRVLGEVPPVRANPARLGQLLLNLILNAAQAIVEGDYGGNAIRIATSLDDDGRVAIAIRDSGAGIAPAVRHRIFAPLFTTKPDGVGLGLTLARRIARSFGGEIDLTSDEGVGTEVVVRLPPDHPPVVAPAPAPAVAVRALVLVIDDDPLVVRTIARILTSHHEVVTVDNAADGLALIDGGEAFDVILCDLMMPLMTGMDFKLALEARAPDQAARIVFVTGGAFTQRAREFLESDGNRRLDKPFSPATLRAAVDDVIRALA